MLRHLIVALAIFGSACTTGRVQPQQAGCFPEFSDLPSRPPAAAQLVPQGLHAVVAATFSRNGRWLAAVSRGSVALIDVASAEVRATHVVPAVPTTLHFDSTGTRIVFIDGSGTLVVWDLRSDRFSAISPAAGELRTMRLQAHPERPWVAVSYLPKDTTSGHRVAIIDLETGERLHSWSAPEQLDLVAFRDRSVLLAGGVAAPELELISIEGEFVAAFTSESYAVHPTDATLFVHHFPHPPRLIDMRDGSLAHAYAFPRLRGAAWTSAEHLVVLSPENALWRFGAGGTLERFADAPSPWLERALRGTPPIDVDGMDAAGDLSEAESVLAIHPDGHALFGHDDDLVLRRAGDASGDHRFSRQPVAVPRLESRLQERVRELQAQRAGVPHGRHWVTGGSNGERITMEASEPYRVFARTPAHPTPIHVPCQRPQAAAIQRDALALRCGGKTRLFRRIGAAYRLLAEDEGRVQRIDPTGRWGIITGREGRLLFSFEEGRVLRRLRNQHRAFSQDGEHMLLERRGRLRLVRSRDGVVVAEGEVEELTFSVAGARAHANGVFHANDVYVWRVGSTLRVEAFPHAVLLDDGLYRCEEFQLHLTSLSTMADRVVGSCLPTHDTSLSELVAPGILRLGDTLYAVGGERAGERLRLGAEDCWADESGSISRLPTSEGLLLRERGDLLNATLRRPLESDVDEELFARWGLMAATAEHPQE